METWLALLLTYFFGGITFVPLVLTIIIAHGLYAFPRRTNVDAIATKVYNSKNDIVQPGDDTEALEAATKGRDGRTDTTSMDVAAGFFAVCREYTPMGINAKPIERSTPVGSATVAAPSPSVYQTMYRSIFERKTTNATQGVGENNGMSQRPKNARNMFYVVLRHGHLMLFDNEEQLEVRHVISLAHHDVSVYSGGDVTPEGELWIKRNALCLSRRAEDTADLAPEAKVSKPFYLFSENCSAKEDFYFALLRNKEQTLGTGEAVPKVQPFNVRNVISLVQKLHSSEDNVHSRWLNAMIGRVFLGLYKTKDLENMIVEKLTKKIARVKRPSFLTDVVIRSVNVGDSAPMFNNLRLKDLTVEGECVIEADIRYNGNARLEVAATAKIDLGQRFKTREVNLVLAVVLKRLEGHIMFKIKPPPSNRVWFSFQTTPKMEMAVEPIVSSRQITYTVILRQIENRIKEVLAETLVQPFWDDMPFFNTEHKKWRGGIFEGDDALPERKTTVESSAAEAGNVETVNKLEDNPSDFSADAKPLERSQTSPTEPPSPASSIFGIKRGKGSANLPASSASLSSVDLKTSVSLTAPSSNLAINTEPAVSTDTAHADTFKPSTSPPGHATSYMAAIRAKVQQDASSPPLGPVLPTETSSGAKRSSVSSAASSGKINVAEDQAEESESVDSGRRNTASSSGSTSPIDTTESLNKSNKRSSAQSSVKAFVMRRENSSRSLADSDHNASHSDNNSVHSAASHKKTALAAVTNAALQARQWGWNAFQRQKNARKNHGSSRSVDLSQPMGRGQPLPPPGVPLPGPTNARPNVGPVTSTPTSASASASGSPPKRKPVPIAIPEQQEETEGYVQQSSLPSKKRRGGSAVEDEPIVEQMLIVEAPEDSEPNSPIEDKSHGSDRRVVQGTLASALEAHPSLMIPSTMHSPPAIHLEHDEAAATSGQTSQPTTTSSTISPERKHLRPDANGPIVAVPASTTSEEEGEVDDDYSGWLEEEEAAQPLPKPLRKEEGDEWRTQHDKLTGHELLVP